MTENITFFADGMLGSLARKLRIWGFNVLYDTTTDDQLLLDLVRKEKRVLLTADRDLFGIAKKRGVNSILVQENTDEDRLIAIFTELQMEEVQLDHAKSRCPKCNGYLVAANRQDLPKKVPHGILNSHQEFYSCSPCDKVYWLGSHWNRILKQAKNIEERLKRD